MEIINNKLIKPYQFEPMILTEAQNYKTNVDKNLNNYVKKYHNIRQASLGMAYVHTFSG